MSDHDRLRRTSLVALGVVSLHAGLIWAVQRPAVVPAPELLVPVSLLSQPADAPAPVALPHPLAWQKSPVPPTQPKAATQPAPAPSKPKSREIATAPPQTSPAPLAPADPSQAAGAPASTSAVGAAASSKASAASAAAVAPAEPGAAPMPAPAVELPSSNADYLRNPKPVYPALSKRLNEQGTVIHSVLIAADGRPVSATLVQSSGFDRLDKAAYEAVMQWRYVPGKRQGVPEAMTFNVPIKWVLE